MPTPVRILALAVAGTALVGVAACGGSDSPTTVAPVSTASATSASASPTTGSTTSTSTTSGTTGAATNATPAAAPAGKQGLAVTVTMGTPQPFSFTPDTPTVKAGKVTFTAVNKGSMPHQLVVLKTTKKAADLPIDNSTQTASEAGKVGAIPSLPAGATKTVTVTLTPGHYALICNLPGHYQGGMRADLTVT